MNTSCPPTENVNEASRFKYTEEMSRDVHVSGKDPRPACIIQTGCRISAWCILQVSDT